MPAPTLGRFNSQATDVVSETPVAPLVGGTEATEGPPGVVPVPVPVPVPEEFVELIEKRSKPTVIGGKLFRAIAINPAWALVEKKLDFSSPLNVTLWLTLIMGPPLMAYDPVIVPVDGSAWICRSSVWIAARLPMD